MTKSSLIKTADFSRDQLIQKLKHLKGLADRPGYEAEGLAAKERMRVIQEKYGITDEEIFGKKPGASKEKSDSGRKSWKPDSEWDPNLKRDPKPKVVSVPKLDLKGKPFAYIFSKIGSGYQSLEGNNFDDMDDALRNLAVAAGFRTTSEVLKKGNILVFKSLLGRITLDFLEDRKTFALALHVLHELLNLNYKKEVLLVINGDYQRKSVKEAINFIKTYNSSYGF